MGHFCIIMHILLSMREWTPLVRHNPASILATMAILLRGVVTAQRYNVFCVH